VQLQELCPAHACLAALRCGLQVVTAQDVPPRDRVDVMPQVRQSALDAPITPARMLLGHLDRKPLDLFRYRWPAKLGAALAPVELLRDEAVIPVQEGVWGGDCGDLFQACATEPVCERREAAAFGVCQVQPATAEVGFKDAVFLVQVGDDLLMVTVDPVSEHGE
jgi:hypothetical protein